MWINDRVREGLTLWTFLYGDGYVSFKVLLDDDMLGHFVLSDATREGYLTCSVGFTSAYRITPLGMEVARES